MYVNTQNMNSYMNSYMNKHIWRSGCSKYGDQDVPDPNYDEDFCFGAAVAVNH